MGSSGSQEHTGMIYYVPVRMTVMTKMLIMTVIIIMMMMLMRMKINPIW